MPSSRPMDGIRSIPKENGMSSATPMVAVMPGIAPSRTPPFRLFPCRKKPIFMHLQHRHSSSRTFPQPAFQSFYFPFLRYRGFLQQFAFFHANAPKLHIQNTQFWRRSFKKIRAAPAAISSETVPQLYFPPKRAEWYCHKAAQPFCIVLTSLFLLITIL